VEAGRQDPVEMRIHVRSTQRRGTGRPPVKPRTAGDQSGTRACGGGAPAQADTGSDGDQPALSALHAKVPRAAPVSTRARRNDISD
jgi:hypothetical protein